MHGEGMICFLQGRFEGRCENKSCDYLYFTHLDTGIANFVMVLLLQLLVL